MEKVPADLNRVFANNPAAKAQWKGLTPIARRDFISWIMGAKQLETRKRRVESVPSRLASGKRRPCCYAIVPMNLYKALADIPKAKAQWKTLIPDARRDFVDWIDEASEPSLRMQRIEKVCVLLSQGKRRP
jgi:uncharacterized protein YdeI (YjbR/CyaY-like superfamily)